MHENVLRCIFPEMLAGRNPMQLKLLYYVYKY